MVVVDNNAIQHEEEHDGSKRKRKERGEGERGPGRKIDLLVITWVRVLLSRYE